MARWPKKQTQIKSETTRNTATASDLETETIHVGRLNGGYVILVQSEFDRITEMLDRAGYRPTFRNERLMHGTSEGDVVRGKVMTAGAGS